MRILNDLPTAFRLAILRPCGLVVLGIVLTAGLPAQVGGFGISPLDTPSNMQDQTAGILSNDSLQQLRVAMKPLHDATVILEEDPPMSPDKLAEASDLSRRALEFIEATTTVLPVDDPRSLFWTAALSDAWCVAGWTAFDAKDFASAENFLRASWRVSQDKTSSFLLARVLEARGAGAEAAALYGFASVARADNPLGLWGFSFLTDYQEEADEKKWTLRLLPTSIPSRKEFTDPRRDQIAAQNKVRLFAHPTKLDGTAVFLVAFESNRPISAVWYGGEKSLASLEPTIKEHVFPPVFPNDSKARLWREIRVVCKPEAGCDAYFQLPTRIDIPSGRLDMNLVKPEMPSWIKMLTIQLQPE